jgi:hypothetical protein
MQIDKPAIHIYPKNGDTFSVGCKILRKDEISKIPEA